MDIERAKNKLASIIKSIAAIHRDLLEELKKEAIGLTREDFVWHYLLQSFSTMGRASGWHGLIGNQDNYRQVTYDALSMLLPDDRKSQIKQVCRRAGIRMPERKAEFIFKCFDYIQSLGGPRIVKDKLLGLPGRESKIEFLRTFPGIGPKYARNIMMDVYHEDFRDSIAIDIRIAAISKELGLTFSTYEEHESFYLDIAKRAGVNGWELDRVIFNFRTDIENGLRAP